MVIHGDSELATVQQLIFFGGVETSNRHCLFMRVMRVLYACFMIMGGYCTRFVQYKDFKILQFYMVSNMV